jgi:hypothetical protein
LPLCQLKYPPFIAYPDGGITIFPLRSRLAKV